MTTDLPQISDREREILRLVARGATNQQIAQELNISINTVKVHLRNIFGKIGAASRTEATVYAIKQGLVEVGGETTAVTTIAVPPTTPATSSFEPQVEQVETPPSVPLKTPTLDTQPPTQASTTELAATNAQIATEPAKVITQPGANPANTSHEPTRHRTPLIAALFVVGLLAAALIGYLLRPSNVDAPLSATAVPSIANTQRWHSRTGLPSSRSNFALANFNRALYVIGGLQANKTVGTVSRYDQESDSWTQLADKPMPVSQAQAVSIGGKIYIPGGETSQGAPTLRGEVYDTRTNEWSPMPDLPAPRSRYALVVVEGKIYLFGGWDGQQPCSEVFAFDPTSQEWTMLTAMPTARQGLSAAVIDNSIYLIGGENTSGPLRANERFRPFEGVTGQWDNQEPLPAPIATPAAIGLLTSISVIDPALSTVHSFTPSAGTWTTKSYTDISLSNEAIGVNSSIFVFGKANSGTPQPLTEFQGIYSTFLPGTTSN